MARITGIGGVFLRSQDSKALAKWYADHLGLTLNDFGGATFLWSDEVPVGTGMTTWSAFPANTTYFGDGPQASAIARQRLMQPSRRQVCEPGHEH